MEPVIYAGCTNNVQAQSTGRSGVQNCWRSCNAASSSEQMNKRLGVAQTPELLDDDALASPASLSPACSERSPHCLSREAQTPIVHQERKGAIPKSERLIICTQVSGIWWPWPASDRPTQWLHHLATVALWFPARCTALRCPVMFSPLRLARCVLVCLLLAPPLLLAVIGHLRQLT
jgi:hypothetical protein